MRYSLHVFVRYSLHVFFNCFDVVKTVKWVSIPMYTSTFDSFFFSHSPCGGPICAFITSPFHEVSLGLSNSFYAIFCLCDRDVIQFSYNVVFVCILPPIQLLECQEPLGMENGTMSDGQISASSEFSSNDAAIHGRLRYKPEHPKAGAWAADLPLDHNQWLQIDLRSRQTKVTRVATQGRFDYHQWVTNYKLQYGNDEDSLHYFKEQGQRADKVRLHNSLLMHLNCIRSHIHPLCQKANTSI